MTRTRQGADFLFQIQDQDDAFCPEEFSEEQRLIAQTAEEFAQKKVLPLMEEIDKQDFDLVKRLLAEAGDLGLLGVEIPDRFGGLELDKVTSLIVTEKMGPTGSFSVAFSGQTGIGSLPLVDYGNEEQQKRYLERIGSGQLLCAYALTEAESGSDALSAKTRAVLDEKKGVWRIDGAKRFITNAGFAGLFTVFAKVDGKHFSAFLIDRDTKGLSLGAEERKLGIKGSSTREVIFENAEVPKENLLGEIGRGHKIALNILNLGRLKLGAATVGTAKKALMDAVVYACERKQFGRSVASFGAIREKMSDRLSEIFGAESMVYRTAGMIDAGLVHWKKIKPHSTTKPDSIIENFSVECATTKVFCSDVLSRVVDDVVQIFGGYGFIADYPAERYYRDERCNRIFEGTNEINRLLIPQTILKRSKLGQIPLQEAAMEAFEDLSSQHLGALWNGHELVAEQRLLERMKKLFLVMLGTAVDDFGEGIKEEQEILIRLADLVISIYTLESSLLRALKIIDQGSSMQKKTVKAVLKILGFEAGKSFGRNLEQIAYYIGAGDKLERLLRMITDNIRFDATGLLDAKRLLAEDLIAGGGRYRFV